MTKIYITNADELESLLCDRREQETAINWLRDDDLIEICTSDNTFITKMAKLMSKDPVNYRCFYYECNRDKATGKLGNYFFEFPKKLLSFRTSSNKTVRKRTLSDEERKTLRARFEAGKSKKRNPK